MTLAKLKQFKQAMIDFEYYLEISNSGFFLMPIKSILYQNEIKIESGFFKTCLNERYLLLLLTFVNKF